MERILPMDVWVGPEMAYSRSRFKDRLLGVLTGAIMHFFMVEHARRNKQTKWVQHWSGEIDRLINLDLVVILVTDIKGRWDKQKALAETIEDIRSAEKRYNGAAARYVAKVYGLKKMRQELPDDISEQFYAMVQECADRVLDPNYP